MDDHSGDRESISEKDDGEIDDSYSNYFNNNLETKSDARLPGDIDFYSDFPKSEDEADEEPLPEPKYYKAVYKTNQRQSIQNI